MSSHHQITVVQVNACREEVVQLGEVLGRVPVMEIKEVLNSEWAKQKGWRCLTMNQSYHLTLSHHIGMEIQIDELGEARLFRRAQMETDYGDQESMRRQLDQELDELEQTYNLRFHEVVGRSMARALIHQAEKEGHIIVDKIGMPDELTAAHDTGVIDLEIRLQVYV